jgi:hypothetical protein
MENRAELEKELHDLQELIDSDYYDTALACAEIGYRCGTDGWGDPRIQALIKEKTRIRLQINELKEKLGIKPPVKLEDFGYIPSVDDNLLPF